MSHVRTCNLARIHESHTSITKPNGNNSILWNSSCFPSTFLSFICKHCVTMILKRTIWLKFILYCTKNVKVLKLHVFPKILPLISRWTKESNVPSYHMHRTIKSNYRWSTAQNCIGIPATIVCTISSSSIYKPPPLQFFCVQLQIKISGQHNTWSRWCCTLLPPVSVFMAQGKDTFSKQSNCSSWTKAPPKRAYELTGVGQKGS